MSLEPTHASWFSGVGGLDLGLERAGFRTVSFSEIDPYASAVLAERWPGVPNLGDVVRVAAGEPPRSADGGHGTADGQSNARSPWHAATLWTGGFPCQDLSVAGKRRGMVEGTRSNLAFAFLDLVERHRPPAILLENVPGLLSSHRGRDMAALLGRMAELGYGVAYRVLDARHFGVPQRRRRVFVLGLRSGPDDPTGRLAAERAAAVLAVGTRCPRHPAAGGEAGTDATDGTIVGTIPAGLGHHGNGGHSSQAVNSGHVIVGETPDPGGVRAADGLAGRLDGGGELAPTLRVGPAKAADGGPGDTVPIVTVGTLREHVRPGSNTDYTVIQTAATLNSGGNDGGFRTEPGEHLVTVRRATRARFAGDADRWEVTDEAGSLNGWDLRHGEGNELAIGGIPSPAVRDGGPLQSDDPLLPLGLDSHRYRCCGNGVVAPVSEWLGRRLYAELAA